jgi:hypothetical protein
MVFSMPEVLILNHFSRVLPKYLNLKKDEMDENKKLIMHNAKRLENVQILL